MYFGVICYDICYDIIQHNHNLPHYLLFQQYDVHRIHNSSEITLKYLCASWALIDVLKHKTISQPFQIDLCINYKSCISHSTEFDEEKQELQHIFTEWNDQNHNAHSLGDIRHKLCVLKYHTFKYCDDGIYLASDMIIHGYVRLIVRMQNIPLDIINLLLQYLGDMISFLTNRFDGFREKYNVNPSYKRFIILADR